MTLEFSPAPVGFGIVFARRDLPGIPSIPARVMYRTEVPRRSNLSRGMAAVDMVEHVLAACAGLGIDNCQIISNHAEMPGFDGSSQPYVDALLAAGIVQQHAIRARLTVTHPVRVEDGGAWIEANVSVTGVPRFRYELHYQDVPSIGSQVFEVDVTTSNFVREIAAARTFLTMDEAATLQRRGCGARVNYSDLLVFDQRGLIQNSLRFDNECARHKLLDMVGDFALAGCDIVAQIIAHRSGHRLNAELVRRLLELFPVEHRQDRAA